jgi:hypothetical protein
MNLIDYTYFEGFIDIPNTNKESISTFLDSEIARLQPIFLESVFGYEFQKAMLDNSSDQRFEHIITGNEFTDIKGNLQKWNGINNPLAYYVYSYYLKDNLNGLAGIGFTTAKAENSERVTAIDKPVNVFNKMVSELEVLRAYLVANENDYTADNLIFNNFDKINSFGI